MHPPSTEQTKPPLEAVSVLAVHTGLRQGALLGFNWEDVDLAAGTIQVRRKGSRRTVKLTQRAVEAVT
jgi:integrase